LIHINGHDKRAPAPPLPEKCIPLPKSPAQPFRDVIGFIPPFEKMCWGRRPERKLLKPVSPHPT
jgi:hypothetical protein